MGLTSTRSSPFLLCARRSASCVDITPSISPESAITRTSGTLDALVDTNSAAPAGAPEGRSVSSPCGVPVPSLYERMDGGSPASPPGKDEAAAPDRGADPGGPKCRPTRARKQRPCKRRGARSPRQGGASDLPRGSPPSAGGPPCSRGPPLAAEGALLASGSSLPSLRGTPSSPRVEAPSPRGTPSSPRSGEPRLAARDALLALQSSSLASQSRSLPLQRGRPSSPAGSSLPRSGGTPSSPRVSPPRFEGRSPRSAVKGLLALQSRTSPRLGGGPSPCSKSRAPRRPEGGSSRPAVELPSLPSRAPSPGGTPSSQWRDPRLAAEEPPSQQRKSVPDVERPCPAPGSPPSGHHEVDGDRGRLGGTASATSLATNSSSGMAPRSAFWSLDHGATLRSCASRTPTTTM